MGRPPNATAMPVTPTVMRKLRRDSARNLNAPYVPVMAQASLAAR